MKRGLTASFMRCTRWKLPCAKGLSSNFAKTGGLARTHPTYHHTQQRKLTPHMAPHTLSRMPSPRNQIHTPPLQSLTLHPQSGAYDPSAWTCARCYNPLPSDQPKEKSARLDTTASSCVSVTPLYGVHRFCLLVRGRDCARPLAYIRDIKWSQKRTKPRRPRWHPAASSYCTTSL